MAAVGGGAIRFTSGASLRVRDSRRCAPGRPIPCSSSAATSARCARPFTTTRWSAGYGARGRGETHRLGVLGGFRPGPRRCARWPARRDPLGVVQPPGRISPQVTVDPNAIFVQDGDVWTSAGVTTGIDMSLAMVEQDHGAHVADAIAARFVLYVRRPGFQSQFSDELVAQRKASAPLAGRARMGTREPTRAGCRRRARAARRDVAADLPQPMRRAARHDTGQAHRALRVEHARTLLTTTALGTKTVAARSGFGSPGQMARVFKRTLGESPQRVRRAAWEEASGVGNALTGCTPATRAAEHRVRNRRACGR